VFVGRGVRVAASGKLSCAVGSPQLQIARDEVLLDCHIPDSGSAGGVFTFCTGVRMDR